ncbi:ABC transporter permease [Diplocloster agilis]|uniref:ABC transporter permease n=1 Tax=Diplocloster agilis TaxID=2850323 RepID=UPI0008219679|nr:ABC transporter permease [Suonthocola fibrivorans]MCU6734602.1 ABC transporter permease [Suonthocola fibrivorans]SCJ46769.1 Uncharacterized protein conserved in bacteria [uncultured Clostridium sp.]
MGKLMRIELLKAVRNRYLWITFGAVLAVGAIQCAYLLWSLGNGAAAGSGASDLSVRSTGLSMTRAISSLLVMCPYGWSYLAETRHGYWKQIITRTGRKNYVLAKYAVIFLTSGFAAAVPLTLQMTAEYGIRWRYLDLELPGFVHNPVLSVLLYFIGEWILSGLMAGFGLMISMFCKHMAAAIGIPGLFCLLYRLANAGLFSHLASSGTGDGTALIFQGILLGEVLLLFAVTLPVCVYRGEHLDVLEEGSRADEN